MRAVDLAVRADADEAEQMFEQLADGFDVLLRPFFQQAAFERAMEVEHRAVRDRLVSDQDVAFEHLFRDHVGRPADETVDDEALAVGRGDRAARSAEVDPYVEDLGVSSHQVPFLCGASLALAYAWIP